ncbi:MAG: flippase-like domain-containing protein [Alphaproteobacteria bacterium]|nr:flippase-like domain-containing protein [Alphaproteobacteria bacterium]MBV8548728.1 flippase-like domain-containing protein [Alphaproteobacteria bacterium]
MLRWAAFFGLLGLFVATGLIVWSGYDALVAALQTAGWGILWTSLFHLVSMLACVIGWRALMPGRKRISIPFLYYVLWLRAAVNNLMPVARIGGEIVAVRVMVKHRFRRSIAVASTVVELTSSVIAVFIFDILGIGLFALHVTNHDLGLKLLAGLLISVPPIAAMVYVQKLGFFGVLDKIFTVMLRDTWKDIVNNRFAGSVAMLDRAVHSLYRRYGNVVFCTVWQFIAWALGAVEIGLGLHYLGHPLDWTECVMVEALIQASASIAFAVPGAIGVQEAGFVFFGGMLGLPRETALALAVIRRCRDLIIYVPGLLVWQAQEGRWLFSRSAPQQIDG